MEFTIHNQVLGLVFLIAVVMGAVASKTNFCTMGAVSDWVNMGDTGRLRSWLFAIAVALLGVLLLEGSGKVTLPSDTFPPYRTANFAWLRYVLGGLMFGIGMTLGSGCGNKAFVRLGGGNMKSLIVLVIASIAAYYMLWGDIKGAGFFDVVFNSWIAPTSIDLGAHGINSQELGAIVAGLTGTNATTLHFAIGGIVVIGLMFFVFKSKDFRDSFDNILGGLVIGLAVIAGWYITGGTMGAAWKDYAEMAVDIPSRVNVQSYTFISPMGDSVRYLMHPTNLSLVNFGVIAVAGVSLGSLLYSLIARKYRFEWFASGKDFVAHAFGAVLMGTGGVLAMGCTIGQGITGISTLALGSILTFVSIVFGSALTMKVQYYLMDEQGFFGALRSSLTDLRLMPRKA
jgi:uncharacterized membrane protein YedE/YeeE